MSGPNEHIDAFEATGLARVQISAGQPIAFCTVEWRSMHPEDDHEPGGAATTRTFGVRSLKVSAQNSHFGVPDTDATGTSRLKARIPELLRVAARPRYYPYTQPDGLFGANKLHFWTPDNARGVVARFLESDIAADVLVVPEPNWETQKRFQVDLAPLRLHEGALRADLLRSESAPFFKELSFRDGKLFEAFQPVLTDIGGKTDERWPVSVTPDGIEFDAAVPDPTRLTSEPGRLLYARFRLEYADDGTEAGFLVRLVGPARDEAGHATNSRESLDRATSRLAEMLSEGARDGAPSVFRFDPRAGIPALDWPLDYKNGLIVRKSIAGEPVVRIDSSAVDLRLVTESKHLSALNGLARVHGNQFALHRTATTVELKVSAGGLDDGRSMDLLYIRTAETGAPADQKFALSLSKLNVNHTDVAAPLEPVIARVGEAYVESGAMSAGAPPPYAFFALQEGWLQWPLEIDDKAADARPDGAAEQTVPEEDTNTNAMTGRIVAVTDEAATSAARGLVVDDATGVSVALTWSIENASSVLVSVLVSVTGAAGRYLGFLFVADTGPDAAEALPTWTGGDASVYEVPLWFGQLPRGRHLPASFTWIAGGDWHIDLDPANAPDDPKRPVLSWSPPDRYPFVTSFPLTRSASAAPVPSLSRGLVPRVYKNSGAPKERRFRLDYKAGHLAEPSPEAIQSGPNELPTIRGYLKNQELAGELFEWDSQYSGGMLTQSLLLPSLMGVVFDPIEENGKRRYSAHLRYDLPELDELFAWTDPPPAEPEQVLVSTPAPPEADENAPVTTALYPMALARLWEKSRLRMRLTWTQDAAVGQALRMNAVKVPVAYDALAAPWSYFANTAVCLTEENLFGELEIEGQPSGLDGAAAGIGGRLKSADKPLALKLDASSGALQEADDPKNATLFVTGNAVDLYYHDGHDVDARGTAFKAAPEAKTEASVSLRSVVRHLEDGQANFGKDSLKLLTTLAPIEIPAVKFRDAAGHLFQTKIECPAVKLCLRDLPIRKMRDKKWLFNGVTGASKEYPDAKTGNPIEGARGLSGQGFDAENFSDSLFEWRFFAEPKKEVLGQYTIPFDMFAFRPLRLGHVTCDETGRVEAFSILGSVGLKEAPLETEAKFAFASDDVYGRNDLFLLTFARTGADPEWSLVCTPQKQAANGANGQIELEVRENPTITIRRTLADRATGTILSEHPVDAELRLNIASAGAELSAVVFGKMQTLTDGAKSFGNDETKFTFDLSEHGSRDAMVSLANARLNVFLSAAGGLSTMNVEGSLCVRGTDDDNPILSLFGTAAKWLDLEFEPNNLLLKIDHQQGAAWLVTKKAEPIELKKGAQPLFHFAFSTVSTLDIAFGGAFTAGEPGKELDFASAFALVCVQGKTKATSRICHELRVAPNLSKAHNQLTIDWQEESTSSKIHWPIEGLELEGSPNLKQISDGPIEAKGDGDTPAGKQSRVLKIAANAKTAGHTVEIRWRGHSMAVADLERSGTAGSLKPVRPLRFLMAIKHTLINGDSSVSWDGLDHVCLTTPALIAAEADSLTFVPRQSRISRTKPGTAPLKYRAVNVGAYGAEGVAPAKDANLSGIHDQTLLQHLWNKDTNDIVLVGNAPLRLLRNDVPAAHILVLPWLTGVSKELQVPDAQDRHWRLPTADVWAAHAVEDTGPKPMVGLNNGLSGHDLARRAMGDAWGPDDIIPVEQSLVELLDEKGNAVELQHAKDVFCAPLFARALLALWAHWSRAENAPWRVESLALRKEPGSVRSQGSTALRRVIMARERSAATGMNELPLRDAKMLLVSRRELEEQATGRAVSVGVSAGLAVEQTDLAELRELAERAMPDALVVLRIAESDTGRPIVITQSVQRENDPLNRAGHVLTSPENDIGTSPLLGWPVASAATTEGDLAGELGPEFAVQVPQAGFAGRSQRVFWPAVAHARSGGSSVNSHYTSFAHHVVYDRGEDPFAFDGPAARHLLPNPARRRAPNDGLATRALEGVSAAPLSMPVVDRTVIGLRSGVMTVMTSAQKLSGENGGVALDAGWPQLGRSADSGPVLAHQVRSPRSPVLPADPKPSDLPLRRRTYLSPADLSSDGDLLPFLRFEGPADVMRIEQSFDVSWRIAFRPAAAAKEPRLLIGTNWNGRLGIEVDAVHSGVQNLGLETLLGVTPGDETKGVEVALQIGSQTAEPVSIKWEPLTTAATGTRKKALLSLRFGISDALSSEIFASTARTPMALSIGFPNAWTNQTPGTGTASQSQISRAPVREVLLPVMRDPDGRRTVTTSMTTVAFGDPSYDRALGSPTLADTGRNDKGLVLLAADRREYNPDSMMYLAAGQIDEIGGGFAANNEEITLRFERLPMGAAGTQVQPEPETLFLLLSGTPLEEATIEAGKAVGFRLNQVVDRMGRPVMAPGDKFVVKAKVPSLEKKDLVLRAGIVAAPVIAPPSTIYTVFETRTGDIGGSASRPRLRAPSTPPTRLEFPDLDGDLARGHVRRQALFVWRYMVPRRPKGQDDAPAKHDLIKLDRSGGFQAPVPGSAGQ